MFSKTKDNGSTPPEAPSQQVRRPNGAARVSAPSIICADMTVSGTITCTGDMQIDGKIEGDIYSSRLTVGEKAVISGEIRADEVTIRGHVIGGIRARKVNLAATCHVEGDITHNALAVETGAFFQGNIRHADDPLGDAMSEAQAAIGAKADPTPPPMAETAPMHQDMPHHQPVQPQPAPAQQAAQQPAPPPAQPRARQTFAQFGNGAAAPQAAPADRPAPRADANDALNAALQKLNAGSAPPPRPAAAQPRQPGLPGGNGQFPPRNNS